jgi:hypothetical protein
VKGNHNGRYILDANGEPQPCEDLLTWGRWLQTADRHVAETRFGDVRVSTVFLGLDHSWGDGPPILWESMVFGGPLDREQRRYATRAEADAGHTALCVAVTEAAARRGAGLAPLCSTTSNTDPDAAPAFTMPTFDPAPFTPSVDSTPDVSPSIDTSFESGFSGGESGGGGGGSDF